jgi:FkbM family methyltransferase
MSKIKKKKGYNFFYRVGIDSDQIDLPFNMYYNKYKFKKEDVVIDMGAHIGTFCIPLAKKVKRIYAFEPNKETYSLLEQNIALNNIENIFSYNYAINDKSGQCELYNGNTNLGNSIIQESESSERVNMMSFRDIMKTIIKADFMKMNVEGAEYNIILNSSNSDLLKVSTMCISYHDDFTYGFSYKDLVKKLKKLKYNVILKTENPQRGIIYASS